MIVVAIIGILLTVALPSYGQYVKDGRRAEAQQYILQQAGLLERNYTRLGRYPTAAEISFELSDYYTYKYEPDGDTKYVFSATPSGKQTGDKCGVLSINQQGVTDAGLTTCWN